MMIRVLTAALVLTGLTGLLAEDKTKSEPTATTPTASSSCEPITPTMASWPICTSGFATIPASCSRSTAPS